MTTEPMLQFFEYAHLPVHLQNISMPFCHLARNLVMFLPRNPERTVCLRKLLEAKDCAVRAALYVDPEVVRVAFNHIEGSRLTSDLEQMPRVPGAARAGRGGGC